ncbi:MAG: hypothetical protein PHV37_04535 [Candidatus Gastranaerophilales bacterium]|nr:hypothetical protein [Candidatus Gastranaerophilales bacterium]
MANFKTKILNTLKNNKNTDNTLNYLSNIQNNLIKNYSNPVFSNQSKNKLLEKYSKVENLGKAIYRHNALKENNINAEQEEENVSNLVLKGGISNCRYVWHSDNSENTCEECAALNGTEYGFEDEVPECPHPNYQCWVEIIENDNDNMDEDKEPCDCLSQLEEWFNECEDACSEAENMGAEMKNSQTDMTDIIDRVSSYSLNGYSVFLSEAEAIVTNTLETLTDLMSQIVESIKIFWSNYNDLTQLKEEVGHYVNWSAEYYHTNANCEAAQLGDAGAKTATILGYLRELGDFPKEILFKGQSIEQAFNNSMHDLEVNEEGRKIGCENPNGNCGDIIKGRIKVDWPQNH